MNASRIFIVALALGPLMCPGCASLAVHISKDMQGPFPGVREDAYYLTHPEKADHPKLQWLCAIDMPLSAVIDTLLLPLDLCNKASRESTNQPSVNL